MAVGSGSEGNGTQSPDGAVTRKPLFRGVTELALDAKGRIAVPSRHRDELVAGGDGRVIVTADHGGCLLIYPMETWDPIQAQIMALPSFDDRIRSIQRLYVGHADDVSGRISGAPGGAPRPKKRNRTAGPKGGVAPRSRSNSRRHWPDPVRGPRLDAGGTAGRAAAPTITR